MEFVKEVFEKVLSEVIFNVLCVNVVIYFNVTGLSMTAKDVDGVCASLVT